MWKPLKLQGLGPGGIIGAHELQARAPEDPRFHVHGHGHRRPLLPGANASTRRARTRRAPYAGVDAAPPGARAAPTSPSVATVDHRLRHRRRRHRCASTRRASTASALMTGRRRRAPAASSCRPTPTTPRSPTTCSRTTAASSPAASAVGQPYRTTARTTTTTSTIPYDRLIGNGGLTRSGGIGIFYGSNNYEVANSIVCSNFGVEYGAGISHWGLSPGGTIHDNQIYYNESVDSGAGISIQSRAAVGGGLGDGSGDGRHRPQPDPEQLLERRRRRHLRARRAERAGSTSATT